MIINYNLAGFLFHKNTCFDLFSNTNGKILLFCELINDLVIFRLQLTFALSKRFKLNPIWNRIGD